MYEGKEPCAGCGRSGAEEPRKEKNCLCHDCQRELAVGRQVLNEQQTVEKYVNAFLHFHQFYSQDCSNAAHKLLAAIHNPDACNCRYDSIEHKYSGSNGKRYNIPEKYYEAIREFILTFNEAWSELRTAKENIPKEVQEALREEKNRIYNEGVAYGRNLLTQLNRGEIGVNDFEKQVIKY